VVLALDGVRYQDVFEGADPELARRHGLPATHLPISAELMPQLHELMHQQGAALGAPGGAPISASGPEFVSLPGYSGARSEATRSALESAENEAPWPGHDDFGRDR
jgi:hypothetical protein